MSLTHLIAEFEHESANTRKMLEKVQQEKFDWRPHPKSMTLKSLSSHIAGLAAWPGLIAKTDVVDLANVKSQKEIKTTADLVEEFDLNVQQTRAVLSEAKEEELRNKWILKSGGHVILEIPKSVAIRSIAMNHVIHHRAQLSVYLRLLDVAVPGMYGPSADEK